MTTDPFQAVRALINDEKNTAFEHWEHSKGKLYLHSFLSLRRNQPRLIRFRFRIMVPVAIAVLLLSVLSIRFFTPDPEPKNLRIHIEHTLRELSNPEPSDIEGFEDAPAPQESSPPSDEEWQASLRRIFEQLAREQNHLTAQNQRAQGK